MIALVNAVLLPPSELLLSDTSKFIPKVGFLRAFVLNINTPTSGKNLPKDPDAAVRAVAPVCTPFAIVPLTMS